MHGLMQGAAMAVVLGVAGTAFGGYGFSVGSSAPTYGTTLTFDEPGGPTGATATNAFAGSHGVSYLDAGDGAPYVSDVTGTPGYGWCGTGNSLTAVYGVFMQFDSNITEFSAQFWDPSGPPSFFGGGAVAFLFDNGVQVGDLAGYSFTPAWGGVGDEWVHVTTDGGSVFDEIRILGFGFFPESHMDNASWNAVPAPGAAALLCVAGLGGTRRRRA